MWSYNQQQEAQMQQAGATLDLVSDIYEGYVSIKDNTEVKLGKGVLKIYSGNRMIKKGLAFIFIPVPTPAEDLVGMGYITYGIIKGTIGVAEVIIWMVQQA